MTHRWSDKSHTGARAHPTDYDVGLGLRAVVLVVRTDTWTGHSRRRDTRRDDALPRRILRPRWDVVASPGRAVRAVRAAGVGPLPAGRGHLPAGGRLVPRGS